MNENDNGPSGVLHVVSVPIGNLDDITARAVSVLTRADVIACEDTRRTGKLLGLLGIPKKTLLSLHDYNEAQRAERIVRALADGRTVALVSDAGTPTISDPGFRVVKAVADARLSMSPIPGPCAAIAALSVSGLPTDRFRFLGFAPSKASQLKKWLELVSGDEDTLVCYVGPHHVGRFLKVAVEVLGAQRRAVVAREMTKLFEEFRRGTLAELQDEPGLERGEIVMVIQGRPLEGAPDSATLTEVVTRLMLDGYPPSKAAREAAKRLGASRDEAYGIAVAIRKRERSADDGPGGD